MYSLKSLAVAGALVVGATAHAFAGDLPPPPPMEEPHGLRGTVSHASGLYLRGDIGIGINKSDPKLELRQNGSVLAIPAGSTFRFDDSSLDSSAFFGLGLGYQFNSWFRFDVTGEYRTGARFGGRDTFIWQGARVFDPPGTTAVKLNNQYGGSIKTVLLMANGYVDLGKICALGCLNPYIGAGIGMAHHSFSSVSDISTTTPIDGTGVGIGPSNTFTDYFRKKSRTNLAWALMAGATMSVTEQLKLEFGYRYLNMGRAETGPLAGNNPPATVLRVKDLDSHDFRVGLRWMLDGGKCCGVLAEPEPVYAPPMVRKY